MKLESTRTETVEAPATEQHTQKLTIAALALFVVCYLIVTFHAAANFPLWMDEILSVWASRMPSAARVYYAISHGSEFSPPAYVLLLHYFCRVFGYGLIALRIPSIFATLVTGIATFVIARRHLGAARAAVAFCLVIEGLRTYALQARPYALVVGSFALVLLLWDGFERSPRWRAVGIALLLALGISFHFYAVLLAPCLGLIELICAIRMRRLRIGVWIAIVAGGASVFLWTPIMHAITHYNAGDTSSPAYFAKPTISALIADYCDLFLWEHWNYLFLILIMMVIGAGLLRDRNDGSHPGPEESRSAVEYWAIVFGMLSFPIIVFLLARFHSRTFNSRYTIAAIIGTSTLIAGSLRSSALLRRSIPIVILIACILTAAQWVVHPPAAPTHIAATIPGNDPIVIAEGLQFWPLIENSPPAVRSRVVYLTLPESFPVGDPTNEHQVERWKAIDPSLPVEPMSEFLRQHSSFYVLDMQSADDTPAEYLFRMHRIALVDKQGEALIYHSVPQ